MFDGKTSESLLESDDALAYTPPWITGKSKLINTKKMYKKERTMSLEIASGFIKSLVQILAKLVNKFFIHCKTFDFNKIKKQKKLPIFRKASHWLSYEPLVNQ